MIGDLDLAAFVASAVAHGRITFGDVRRLQRDHLPGGIETRAQAEVLTELTQVKRADRSWRQWFAGALTDFATKSAADGAAARDETIAWLEQLSGTPGLTRRIARKIARELRGDAKPAETAAPAEEVTAEDVKVEAIEPQAPTVPDVVQPDQADDAARRKRTRAAKRSRIVVRQRRPKQARSQNKKEKEPMPLAVMPSLWGWPHLTGEQNPQAPLAAPFW